MLTQLLAGHSRKGNKTMATLSSFYPSGSNAVEFTASKNITEGQLLSVNPASPYNVLPTDSPVSNYTSLGTQSFTRPTNFDSTRTGNELMMSDTTYGFRSYDMLNNTVTTLVNYTSFDRGVSDVGTPYISNNNTYKVTTGAANTQIRLLVNDGTNNAMNSTPYQVIDGASAFPVGTHSGDGILVFADGASNYWLQYGTFRINSYNNITFTSQQVIDYVTSNIRAIRQLPSGKIVVVYFDTSSQVLKIFCIDTMADYNSPVTYGARVVVQAGYDYYTPGIYVDPTNENNIILISQSGEKYKAFTLSGTTFTSGPEVVSPSYSNGESTFTAYLNVYDRGTNKTYAPGNSSWYEVTFPTSTSIDLTTIISRDNNFSNLRVAMQDPVDSGIYKVHSTWTPISNSSAGLFDYDNSIGGVASPDNWIGFASKSVSQGQTAEVYPIGSKVGGFTGLVPFNKMYIDRAVPGEITTNATPGVKYQVGVAVSDTEIIITNVNNSESI